MISINMRRENFGGLIHVMEELKTYSLKFNRLSFRVLELLVLGESEDSIVEIINRESLGKINVLDIKKLVSKLESSGIKLTSIVKYTLNNEDYELWNGKEKLGDRLRSPLHTYWHITNSCNLRCKHCNASSGESDPNELSDDDHMKILEQLIENKVSFISFTGGEPLMKKERLIKLAKRAREEGIAIWLATNAILVTPQIAKELAEVGFFTVQVSIDGIMNHDSVRGKGAFEKTLIGIKNLKEAGIEPTICMAVMRPGMGELDEVIDMAISNGIKKIKFIRFLPIGRGAINAELGFSPAEEREWAKRLYELQSKFDGQIHLALNDSYPGFLGDKKVVREEGWDCNSGRAFSYINSMGDFAPCPYGAVAGLYGGNVLKSKLSYIWNDSELFNEIRQYKNNDKCNSCSNWSACKGGCKVSSYTYYGSLLAPDSLCPKNEGGTHCV